MIPVRIPLLTPAAILSFLFAAVLTSPHAEPVTFDLTGRVVDEATRQPIADAIVTIGESELRSDANGVFYRPSVNPLVHETIGVRAYGYLRAQAPSHTFRGRTVDVPLTPFRPKALYLSVYGIGSTVLRTAALEAIEATSLNALVIDLKGDRGLIPYRTEIPLAATVGAQKLNTIADLPALVADLRGRGIYTIARIVVFKDDPLASTRSDLALHRVGGELFRDREGLAWGDPYNRNWDYNIAVAVEAARAGFDEIQFDYIRLPDAKGIAYALPQTEENRVAPIEGFLRAARQALVPFNVFVAADIFGYVCWNRDDTHIGQKLERIAGVVDYLSPMLYPSSFQFGIPGYRTPVQHPYEIVRLSLDRARERTLMPPVRIRPWLQAFRDYAFDGREFGATEISRQIKAAEDFGADGWMLWNPRNRYPAADVGPTEVTQSDGGGVASSPWIPQVVRVPR
jgi:hypothetical protein